MCGHDPIGRSFSARAASHSERGEGASGFRAAGRSLLVPCELRQRGDALDDEIDVLAKGARTRRLGRSFRWPGGHHVAVVFNIAFEAWTDGRAPGLGPMGNPLPPGTFDSNALLWGHYGMTRGIQRLLRVLDRNSARASVMVSGVIAERRADVVRTIAQAGHEIVAHGYAQDVVGAQLSVEAERTNIHRTTDLLTRAVGTRPIGWMSPRGTPGSETARLLVEAGYLWHGDVFDDDRPYVQVFEGGQIVGIPLTMEINDLPHAMRFGRSPRQFVEAFEDLLDAAMSNEDEALLIDITAHAHCYGRPGGAWAYEEIVRRMRSRGDIWLATRSEIAQQVVQSCPATGQGE